MYDTLFSSGAGGRGEAYLLSAKPGQTKGKRERLPMFLLRGRGGEEYVMGRRMSVGGRREKKKVCADLNEKRGKRRPFDSRGGEKAEGGGIREKEEKFTNYSTPGEKRGRKLKKIFFNQAEGIGMD